MAKARVFITTDIGGSDPDDDQALVHALLASDRYQLEGIVSSPTRFDGRVADVMKVVNAYEHDYANLKTWSADYPTPDYVKSVVYQGKITPQPSQGWSSPTAGSKAIIEAAHESSEPLWVLAWGAMTDIAQALHDDPSIVDNIKVYSLGGWNTAQDPAARNYVYNNFKELFWIENNTTLRGIYVDSTGAEKNPWNKNDAIGHGELGDHFYEARPMGLKMGDTPSLTYLLDNAPDNNPAAPSWGGSFVKTGHGPNYWTDNGDPSLKLWHYNGAKTQLVYQDTIFKDLIQMLDRAKSPKPGSSSDSPVSAQNDSASATTGKAVVIDVLDNDNAPDGGLKISTADGSSSQGGKVVVNSNGTVTYTSKSGYIGNDTFTYTARDADGDTKKATVTVTVKGDSSSNPPPNPNPENGNGKVVANDDAYKIDAGTALYFNAKYLLMNDTAQAGGLKVVGVDVKSDAGATVTWKSDGTIIYNALPGYNGVDRVDYVVSDKNGLKDTGTVAITVGKGSSGPTQPPNTNPEPGPNPNPGNPGSVEAFNDQYKIKVNETLYFNTKYLTWNDTSDVGGLKVTGVSTTSAAGGKVNLDSDGTATYRAPTNWQGTDQIAYTVTDKSGASDTAIVSITVGSGSAKPTLPSSSTSPLPSRDSPPSSSLEAKDDQYNVKIGQTLYFDTKYLTHNDESASGGLKVIAIDSASEYGGKVSFDSDGVATYRAASGFKGVDRINYTVVDKDGNGDGGTLYLNIGGTGTLKLADTAPASLKSTSGNDVLLGDNGNNVMIGGAGNDTLHGNAGNDSLNGGLGNDILWGDKGADKFVVEKGKVGKDVIADFSSAEGDKVVTDYSQSEITGWNTQTLTLQIGGGQAEQLHGIGHVWTPADFLFS